MVREFPASGLGPAEALARLLEGNARYAAGTPRHPRQDPQRRSRLEQGQHPFAAVLGCADSRVPPELVFDQGLGDLFINRVAGNVVGPRMLASLLYGVETLGVPLILVLGHSGCGAVRAALDQLAQEPGNDDPLLCALRPAVETAWARDGDPMDEAVRANVLNVTRELRAHPVLEVRRRRGRLRVEGAIYDLASGRVQLLDEDEVDT